MSLKQFGEPIELELLAPDCFEQESFILTEEKVHQFLQTVFKWSKDMEEKDMFRHLCAV